MQTENLNSSVRLRHNSRTRESDLKVFQLIPIKLILENISLLVAPQT